jgi:hypothetical protein
MCHCIGSRDLQKSSSSYSNEEANEDEDGRLSYANIVSTGNRGYYGLLGEEAV